MLKVKEPEFRLISCTGSPIETMFACWAQSRPTQYPHLFEWLLENEYGSVVTARMVLSAFVDQVLGASEIYEAIKKIIGMPLPILESIHFTWGFASLPIEWREQAVRKRQWGFWLTSMREFGMDDFYEDGRWCPPVPGVGTPQALQRLEEFVAFAEATYNELKELGLPQEVARKVVPLCATHNGTMFSNFRTLLDTLASRSCWIAQVNLWGTVLTSMIRDLRIIHPLLGQIVSPPCFERFENEYKGCKYRLINENRMNQKDKYAVCPLYCFNEAGHLRSQSQGDADGSALWNLILEKAGTQKKYIDQGIQLLSTWKHIWHRDPFTGKIL